MRKSSYFVPHKIIIAKIYIFFALTTVLHHNFSLSSFNYTLIHRQKTKQNIDFCLQIYSLLVTINASNKTLNTLVINLENFVKYSDQLSEALKISSQYL